MSTTNKVFKDTVGQKRAVTQLSESIASAKNGGEMMSPLFIQQAGGGKTHLMTRYLKGLKDDAGINTIFFNSPEEFRESGANWDSIVEMITNGKRFGIGCDESHMLENRKTVRLEKFKAYVMKALDKNNHKRTFRFDGQTTCNFNRKLGSICFGTNFPDDLDGSGALQSRFDVIELDPYTTDELVQILQGLLVESGFQEANEDTLTRIARCGRGTARPMEKIIGQIKMTRDSVGWTRKSINKDDVFNALKLKRMFPRGLTEDEIKMLHLCKTPRRDSVISAFLPMVEKGVIKRAKGFLMAQGFAEQTSQGFIATIEGQAYLLQSKKEGFAVDFNL